MAKSDVNVNIRAKDHASRVFKKIALAAGAFLGVRTLGRVISGTTKAFIVQEQSVKNLEAALGTIGKAGEIEQMKQFASQLQSVTTVGDETTLGLAQLGVTIGGLSGEALQDATLAAVGLSKSMKIDLNAAMLLVSKAAAGNTSAFSRYGVVFNKNMDAQERYNLVLQMGAKGMAIARAEANTFGGITQQLSNTWGDAKERMGEFIANIPGLQTGLKVAGVVIENFGLAWDIAWTQAGLSLLGYWEDFKFLFTTQIPDLWQWFARNWKDVFKTAGSFVASIFVNMGKNIWNFFKSVAGWLKGDGFNFEWTALTEGMKNSIEELPIIAKREMTSVESKLAEQLAISQEKLGKKIAEKLSGAGGPALSGAAALGAGGPGAVAAARGGSLAAVESRFRTGTTRRSAAEKAVVKTEKNTRDMARSIAALVEAFRTGNQNKITASVSSFS